MRIENMTYEQAEKRLNEIVNKLSTASVTLDDMVTLYEEGVALSEHCATLLKGYEARLERVSQNTIIREIAKVIERDSEEI